MTRRQGRRHPVSRPDVRQFVGKAEEWLETAEKALANGRFTAATGTAIRAGISVGVPVASTGIA